MSVCYRFHRKVLSYAIRIKCLIIYCFRGILAVQQHANVNESKVVKLLGVWLQDDMSFTKYVDYITRICNQRLYLLNQLKKPSWPRAELHSVFVAIVCHVCYMHRLLGMGTRLQVTWNLLKKF